jgi:threonine/homoserine/homoserine lactone efflux protein
LVPRTDVDERTRCNIAIFSPHNNPMDSWIDMLMGGLWGLLAGFITAAIGGPINVTVINESAVHGFTRAFVIAVGAVLMELIYSLLAFAGFSKLFAIPVVQAAMELISFLLVLWLGLKYLHAGYVPHENKVEEYVERKLHPRSAFWTGFIRVLGNPGVLLLWIGVTGSLLAHGAMADTWPAKMMFSLGVSVSGLVWFLAISWGIAHGRGKGWLSANGLRQLSKGSGVVLLLTAAGIGIRLVLLLSKHRP